MRKPKRRVVAVAGLEDGRMVVDFLQDSTLVDVAGVFVLNDSFAQEVSGFVHFDDLVSERLLYKIDRIDHAVTDIEALQPDLIVVVGFSQIIPSSVIRLPQLGVVGFHSAVLPGRRGSSPVIWAIIDGLEETGVTMFYMNEDIDAGAIIDVDTFSIEANECSHDVLEKANQATLNLLSRNLEALLRGTCKAVPHDINESVYTRKRTPRDGEIDWTLPAHQVVRLIRALAPPYPMAHAFCGDGTPIIIERAHIADPAELPPPQYVAPNPFQKTVLCVCAHPDDEVLGVGATLVRHVRSGGKVVVLILSEGESEKVDAAKNHSRIRQAEMAAEIIGTDVLNIEDIPDQRFDSVPFIDLIKPIEQAIKEYAPQVVYTHHPGDANTDHQLTFKAVYAATRPMSSTGQSIERLLTFETPSSTDQAPTTDEYTFSPNVFVCIDEDWEKKEQALKAYGTELVGGLHPRSIGYIQALARMRGGYAGCLYAEAFKLVRERHVT